MQFLVGNNIRKDIDFKHEFRAEKGMEFENDDRVETCYPMENGGKVLKYEKNGEKDDDET